MSTFYRFHHSFYVVSVCGIIVGSFFFCGLSSFADSDGLPGSRFTLGTFVLVSLWGRMSILSSRVHILISKVCGQQQRHEKPVCDGSEPEWWPRSAWHTLDPLIFCDRWDTGIHITYCFQLIVLTEGDSDDCCNSDLLLSELWMLDSKTSIVREKEDQPETMVIKWWGYIAPLITRGYYALGDWMPFIVNLKKHFFKNTVWATG